MQVVVAGASGFVGQQVVYEALSQGHQVFALIRAEKDASFGVGSGGLDNMATLPWGGP
jgi:uncharacterized protein YbjT (DUF2867 family)